MSTPKAVNNALEKKRFVLDSPETSPILVCKQAKTTNKNDEEYTQSQASQVIKLEDRDGQIRSASLEESSSAPSTTAEISFTHLPMVLRVSGNDGSTQIVNIDQLPDQIRNDLVDHFETFRTASKYKKKSYRALTSLAHKYIERPCCACGLIRYNLQAVCNRKPTPSQTFLLGGELEVSADDKCTKDRVPCVHIVQYVGGYALCFVPLPKAMRASECWQDLAYWMQK